MSATWPRPWRCCGRSCEGEPPEIDDATIRISDAVERLRSASRLDAPQRARRDARPSRRVGPLRAAQARDRRASRRDQRAAREAGARPSLRPRGRCGRGGLARAAPAVRRAVRLGRGPRRAADRRATCRSSARSCSRIRSTRRKVSLDDYAAEWKWDGIRVQLVHAGGETRLYSRTGDDISDSFPDVAEAFRTPGVLDGELLVRGSDQGSRTSTAARRRASTRSSSGSAARTSARRCLATYPAFVRLYDILFDGGEDLRELPWERASRAARSVRRAARSGAVRRVAADRGQELRRARGAARQCARRRDRGHHAQAPRQRLCRRPPNGAVVQMEARSADRRLRADVRAARVGQTIELLHRLHLRLLDRRRASFFQSARPISASPTRNCVGSTAGSAAIRCSASDRCAKSRKASCSKSRSIPIHRSTRHKSGLAMRFPRISRIRIDKPAAEADRVATLQAMVT